VVDMNNNKRILVVDDDQTTIDLTKTFLEKNGFEVVIAGDGDEAITFANQKVPDLILLDVMLPTIDGFEVCLRLKSHILLKNTPILMVTAKGLDCDIERGEAVGADGYIIKPFSGKDLMVIIRKYLEIN